MHRARVMTDEQRGSLAAYLSVFKGVENGRVKLGLSGHPSLDRAYHTCLQRFKEVGWLPCEGSWYWPESKGLSRV